MRIQPLALAVLLFACADPQDNRVDQADNGITDEPILVDDGGSNAALHPGQPGAPGPEQPAPEQPAPDPSGEVTLSAAPPSAAAGATMTLTLANGLDQPIGYNLCTSGLVRNGTSVQTDRVCTMELRTLQPGARTTYGWELPDDLPDGSYRFTTGVERMTSGSRLVVSSNGFIVR